MSITLPRNHNSLCLLIVASLLLFAPLTECSRSSSYEPFAMKERYNSWLQAHGRKYKTKDEWLFRFGIYQSNVQFIDEINSQGLSYNLTDNKFADMTNEEFKSQFLGYKPTAVGGKIEYLDTIDLPIEVDWRKKGAVNSVKDQGQCGSCWAFSAVSAVESINKIQTGKLVSLSEQQLIDCDSTSDNQGCNGGYMEKAFEFIKKNGGLTTGTDYPYKGKDGKCDTSRSKHHEVSISGYKVVPKNDEKSLQAAVASQPISVAIDAGGYAFQLYSSGVFTGYCGTQLNHGVNAVGYGGDDNKKYWIVRNSWGKSWGESGYIKMQRDTSSKSGLCGIAKQASYPVQSS